VFKAIKSKNGAYSFKEEIISGEEAKTYFK
jgi:hypothetical protein